MKSLMMIIFTFVMLTLSACTSLQHKSKGPRYCGVKYAQDHELLAQIKKQEQKKKFAITKKTETRIIAKKIQNLFTHKKPLLSSNPHHVKNMVRKAEKVQTEAKITKPESLKINEVVGVHVPAGDSCPIVDISIPEKERLMALMFALPSEISEISVLDTETQELLGSAKVEKEKTFFVTVKDFSGKKVSVRVKTSETAVESTRIKMSAGVFLKEGKLKIYYPEKEFNIKTDNPKIPPEIKPQQPPIQKPIHYNPKKESAAKAICLLVLLSSTGGATIFLYRHSREHKKLKNNTRIRGFPPELRRKKKKEAKLLRN